MRLDEFRKGWKGGLPETPCGIGSKIDRTVVQREALARWASELSIESVVDIGAGDLNWIKLVKWPHPVEYRAFDLVPRCAEVEHFDIIHDVPPPADMVLCLWVLDHLVENHARMALANILVSGSKWLVYNWRATLPAFLKLEAAESVMIWPEKEIELRLVLLSDV